jgi:hypothetical protein
MFKESFAQNKWHFVHIPGSISLQGVGSVVKTKINIFFEKKTKDILFRQHTRFY